MSIKSIERKHQEKDLDFNFQSVTEKDVLDEFSRINPRKSPGWDSTISPTLLKEIAPAIAPSLAAIFNLCIDKCCWPTKWKMGEWTPVFKKGDKQAIENYRPITVLPIFGKLFEHMLCKQITTYYDHIMYPKMTAYRKQHSCETTLIGLVEDWRKALDNKEKAYLLSMDMSKAFDSLLPSLTVAKLRAYGFNDKSLALMRSFFSGRLNRVKVGKVTSDWKEMKRGCPQGSSFGPMLWNLYQNDLSYNIKNANLTMYADDHQLYTVGREELNMGMKLERDAAKALTWYKDNYLMVNPNKFQFMKIKPRNDKEQATMSVNSQNIKSTDDIKILGVNFDEHLVFTKHISELCKKASQRVGVLSRLRNLIPTEAKLLLYKVSIMPHLTYCHLIWHFCRTSDSRKVERIQERALRIVFNTHSDDYGSLLKRAKLPSLYNRRLQDIAILMYKVKHGMVPSFISDIFSVKSSKYSLRNRNFDIPRFNSAFYGKHSLRYLGPHLWSKLSNKVKEIGNLQSFKSKIRCLNLNDFINDNCSSCLICSS